MRARRLSELVELMQPAAVEVVGDDTVIGPDVVLDNREATPGSLFVAIPGSRVDGHSFAPQAVAAGAAAVLGSFVTEAEVPHILVEDTVQGLSWLARGLVREERARGMVSFGVTGSSGKTSTKDLLAQVLEARGTTVAPVRRVDASPRQRDGFPGGRAHRVAHLAGWPRRWDGAERRARPRG